jgi:hypothetical protein
MLQSERGTMWRVARAVVRTTLSNKNSVHGWQNMACCAPVGLFCIFANRKSIIQKYLLIDKNNQIKNINISTGVQGLGAHLERLQPGRHMDMGPAHHRSM